MRNEKIVCSVDDEEKENHENVVAAAVFNLLMSSQHKDEFSSQRLKSSLTQV